MLGLASAGAASLRITVIIPLSREAHATLSAALGRAVVEGASLQSTEIEGTAPTQEQTTLTLSRAKDDLKVDGWVALGRDRPAQEGITISPVLSSLSQVTHQQIGVTVQCQFVFSPERYSVTPPLPIAFTAALPRPSTFDEIRGLRLIKLAGKDVDYQIILDRPANADYHVNLWARRTEALDSGVFQRVFGWARAVAETIAQPVNRNSG